MALKSSFFYFLNLQKSELMTEKAAVGIGKNLSQDCKVIPKFSILAYNLQILGRTNALGTSGDQV